MTTGHRPHGPGNKYAGELGTTRKTQVQYACPCGAVVSVEVYVGVDANADPELGQRLVAGDLELNAVRADLGGPRLPRRESVRGADSQPLGAADQAEGERILIRVVRGCRGVVDGTDHRECVGRRCEHRRAIRYLDR